MNNNDNNNDFIYVLVFKAVTNVTNSGRSNELKVKIIRTIINIFQNIIDSELRNQNSEIFRKIQITNPNFSLIFDVKGNYEFFKSLGFNEKYFGEDLCLYLPKENINIPLFYKLISFIELLTLDLQDNNNSQNYFEQNQNQINFQNNNINNMNSQLNNNNQMNYIHFGIIIGNNNFNLGNNFNMLRPPSNEGAKILKETGQERYQRALKFTNNPNNMKIKENKINNFYPNVQTFNYFNQNKFNNNFSNINNNTLNQDEIGKKCFQLTNNFRAQNNLPPLVWDDSIWRISYTHSKNMADKIVPFGHNGFNQRLKQFPFSYKLAYENVFKCLGYGGNKVAFVAIKGWINSPGHRKNLLSNTTHCAIATYISKNGEYYLTQMFARKN